MEWTGKRWEDGVVEDNIGWSSFQNAMDHEVDELPQPYGLVHEIIKGIVDGALEKVDVLKMSSAHESNIQARDYPSVLPAEVAVGARSDGEMSSICESLDGKFAFMGTDQGVVYVFALYMDRFASVATIRQEKSPIVGISCVEMHSAEVDPMGVCGYRVAYSTAKATRVIDFTVNVLTLSVEATQLTRIALKEDSAASVHRVSLNKDARHMSVVLYSGLVNIYALTKSASHFVPVPAPKNASRREAMGGSRENELGSPVATKKFQLLPSAAAADQAENVSGGSVQVELNRNYGLNAKLVRQCAPPLRLVKQKHDEKQHALGMPSSRSRDLTARQEAQEGAPAATLTNPSSSGSASSQANESKFAFATDSSRMLSALGATVFYLDSYKERPMGGLPISYTRKVCVCWEGMQSFFVYTLPEWHSGHKHGKSSPSSSATTSSSTPAASAASAVSPSPSPSSLSNDKQRYMKFDLSADITCSCQDRNGAFMAFGLQDGGVVLFNARSQLVEATLAPHNGPVRSVSLHEDKYLVSAGGDNLCHIFHLQKPNVVTKDLQGDLHAWYALGEPVKTIRGPRFPTNIQYVHCLSALPVCVVVFGDNQVYLVDLVDGALMGNLKLENNRESGDSVTYGHELPREFKLSTDSSMRLDQNHAEALLFCGRDTDTMQSMVFGFDVAKMITEYYPAIGEHVEDLPFHRRRETIIDVFLGTRHTDRNTEANLRGQAPEGLMEKFAADGEGFQYETYDFSDSVSNRGFSRFGSPELRTQSRLPSGLASPHVPRAGGNWSKLGSPVARKRKGKTDGKGYLAANDEKDQNSLFNDISNLVYSQLKAREDSSVDRNRRIGKRMGELKTRFQTLQNLNAARALKASRKQRAK
jgi:hypothetical protein